MNEIVLSGPGKNCLSTAMMDFLIAKLRKANGAPLLLTGGGDAFCAGLDLKELASLDGPRLEAYLRKLELMIDTLYRYPGPTVAAVNGHAIAGGCMLLLCCDLRIATSSPKAKIGLNELALGVRFPPVTMSVVRDRIPPQHQLPVILGAGLFAPAEALRLSLVDELADDPVALARQRLGTLASHPAATYAATKVELHCPVLDAAEAERKFQQMLPAWKAPETRRRIEGALRR